MPVSKDDIIEELFGKSEPKQRKKTKDELKAEKEQQIKEMLSIKKKEKAKQMLEKEKEKLVEIVEDKPVEKTKSTIADLQVENKPEKKRTRSVPEHYLKMTSLLESLNNNISELKDLKTKKNKQKEEVKETLAPAPIKEAVEIKPEAKPVVNEISIPKVTEPVFPMDNFKSLFRRR